MRYSFVILHYVAEDVTVKCVNTLLERFDSGDVDIVVVDNGSSNGSGAALESRYAGKENVHFLLLEKNLGFACGNNEGYRYAVENLNPDFVIVMNNDVMIEDGAFLEKIASEYASAPFAVLGPDIYSPNADVHQSPARLTPMSVEKARAFRRKFELKYRLFFYQYITWNLKLYLHLAKEHKACDADYTTQHTSCVLHGACYIFSKEFIQARQFAFNPSTFLYVEEDILAFECLRDGLVIRYNPDLRVVHLEDVSTNAAIRSACARKKMKYKYLGRSFDVLVKLMEEANHE